MVLLLEDDLITGVRVEKTILTQFPVCRLMWARTIRDAKVRALSLHIDLFLLDVELPDGNGLEFLLDMRRAQPAAHAIVLTATPLPSYKLLSDQLGVLRFLEKPVSAATLLSHMREALSAQLSPAAESANAFRATLENLSSLDILQMKCLTGVTTTLEFHSEGEVGQIHLQHGAVVHAEAGSLRGVPAFNRVVGWKGGEIAEKPAHEQVVRTIDAPWHALLMDAAQAVDEAAHPA